MPDSTSPLFSWLNRWRADQRRGTLHAIFVADAAGAPMRRLNAAECHPGKGLAGDRYAQGTGHWKSVDGCEVTLVTLDDMRGASANGLSFLDGEHRRNLVVAGIPLRAFVRHRVRVGDALFAFHRLRPPCGYLDRVVRPGAAKALRNRGGIGLRVVESGTIKVGDRVEIVGADRG